MSVWPKVKLGEVLRRSAESIIPDASTEYREITVRLWGNGVVERGRALGAAMSGRRFIARTGQFIASRIDARNGATGLIPASLDGALVTNDFPLFNLDASRILPEFFGWLTKTAAFVELCLKASEGTTNRVRLKEDRFLALEIPLSPLAEQRRVVARIEELAIQIHEAHTLRQKTAEEIDAFSASSLVSFLPKKITTRPLGKLLAPDSKLSYGVLIPGPDVEDGVPFVRIQDLSLRSASQVPNKKIAPEIAAQYRRTKLVGGEILMGVVGSIGKIGIVPMSWAGGNIARAVCRIVPGEEVYRDYLAAVLSAQPCQNYFRETTRTLAQPTLNVGQLSLARIPVPSLADQRRIVAELDALQAEVDALKRLQAETAAELDALLPAILDRAFKGEL